MLKMSGQHSECWECLRREIPCDGQTPICRNCQTTRIVCPGYTDRKPLVWLPTGKVSRLQKSKVRRVTTRISEESRRGNSKEIKHEAAVTRSAGAVLPRAVNMNDDGERDFSGITLYNALLTLNESNAPSSMASEGYRESSGQSIFRYQSYSTNTRPIPWSTDAELPWQTFLSIPPDLRPDEWDYIDAIEYANNLLFPAFDSRQIIPNPYCSRRFTRDTFHTLPESHRQCFLAIGIGYRIMFLSRIHDLEIQPAKSGPAAPLWSDFYRRVTAAIGSLNEEIKMNGRANSEAIFSSIAQLLSAEVLICNASMWRAHAAGFLAMVKHCGGLNTLIHTQATDLLTLQSAIIGITLFNTTSSSRDLLVEACNFDLEDVIALYNIGSNPILACPAPLFRNLFLINRLRLRRTTCDASRNTDDLTICSVLQDINAFVIPDLTASTILNNSIDHFAKERYIFVTSIIKAAVALFGIMTVPCTNSCPSQTPCEDLEILYRHDLFRLLKTALSYNILIDHVLWPLVVAGVSAAKGTETQRSLVEAYFLTGVKDPFTGASPISALAVLKKFWKSRKTTWDECFEEPQAWVI